jgi:hypothetical protein
MLYDEAPYFHVLWSDKDTYIVGDRDLCEPWAQLAEKDLLICPVMKRKDTD